MKKRLFTAVCILLLAVLNMPLVVLADEYDTVYVTPYGDKYHNYNCPTISRSRKIPMSREAARRSHGACHVCNPDAYRSAEPAPANYNAGITPEQAAQNAYALYVQNGLDSNTALSRVQAIVPQLASNPAGYAEIVAGDLAALRSAAPAPAAPTGITAEQAVQLAYALYVQSGLDSDTAFARVQQIVPQLMENPAAYAQIVQNDIAGMTAGVPGAGTAAAAVAAPAAPQASSAAEALVQQMYAALIAQGYTSDQALAAINANLPAILQQAQNM